VLSICFFLEYAAFIYLKYKQPNRERPFEVPFGLPGAIALFIPTIIISGVAIGFADRLSLIIGSITTIGVTISYFIKLLWVKVTHYFRNNSIFGSNIN